VVNTLRRAWLGCITLPGSESIRSSRRKRRAQSVASPYKAVIEKMRADLKLDNLEAEYVNQSLEIVYLQGKMDGMQEVRELNRKIEKDLALFREKRKEEHER
jgi:hypothetical protein